MKIFSQRVATFVAFASVAYLASTPSVLGDRAGDAAEMNAADSIGQHTFNALTNDKKHHHHHNVDHHHDHHHDHCHKHHKKPHHDKHPIVKKVHLVCDGKVIDTLKCTTKACGVIAADVEAVDSNSIDTSSSTFDAKNNGGTDSIPQVFIKMDFPCSKEPPKGCAADVAMTSQDATDSTEESDPTETSDDSEETESEDSDTIELAKRDNAADTDFEASNHGAGHKHRHHHHSRHHRHGKNHHHSKHHHHNKHSQKNKHPWKDLCVAVGDFCGSSLYGCDFNYKTWYRCSAIGERPTVIKVDAEECGGPSPVKKCPCPADFVLAVCGSQLPGKCNADPTEIYHCPGGPHSEFEVLKKCPPGTACVPSKHGNDATCGYESCECTGDKEYCSSQFPERCGLKKNTIYKCLDGKLTDVKSCDDTAQECVATGDGAACGSCKCSGDGEICGDAFPLKCRRSATGLYKCKKGESPELIKECLPGYCSTSVVSLSSIVFESEDAKDVCIDGCDCVKEGDFCGRSFSPECGLHANTLYKCSGPRAKPEEKEKCENRCIVKAGSNVCKNDCTCPNADPICGAELPASCNADSNTIYVCRDGNGGTPEPSDICPPGKQCQKRPFPEGAICGSDNCDCTGIGEVCSNAFPEKCGLQKNTIYKCTADGKPDKLKTCEGDKTCVSVADGAVCVNCECVDDGTVCGKIFPRHCNRKATALYTCKKGEDPVLHKDCYPNTCSPSKGDVFEAAAITMDTCIDKCVCVGAGKVCGSTFNPDCNLRGSTLYKCESKGTTPIELEKCKHDECIVSNGDNKCANENKCTCPDGFESVCGSTFPPECNLNADTIYKCFDKGVKPVPGDKCKPGECTDSADGAKCDDPCKCKDKKDVCGSTFPPECKFDVDTIHKCSAVGVDPVPGDKCKPDECADFADGAKCDDPCKCKDKKDVCGLAFPPECKFDVDTIHKCSAVGVDPVPGDKCKPGECADFADGAKCDDPCKCKDKKDVCGLAFPPECKFDVDTIHKCSAVGVDPVPGDKCKPGECADFADGAKCDDPCKCKDKKDVCGSAFPPECKFDVDTIHKCSAVGVDPVPGDKCRPGECTDSANGAKCKGCDAQVTDATTALGAIEQLLENAINTGGSTAVVVAILAKNLEKLKLDLPLAAADALGLGAITGPAEQLVGAVSDLLDTLTNGAADAATTALITALRALATTLGAVNVCAGGDSNDCSSIIQLYKDIKTTAFDLIKGIPGAGTIAAPFIDQLESATDTIDSALESGSGALVAQALSILDGVIGAVTAIPLLKTALAPITALYEAAKAAIKCQLGIDPTGDKCLIFNRRFEGAIAALIDLVKDNLNMIPIFGQYISTPILDALNQILGDVQKGGAGIIGTAVGTLKALLQIINLAGGTGGNDLSNPITNAILSILGLVDGAGDCAEGGDPCSGLIAIAQALIASAANVIGDLIPGASIPIKFLINNFLNPLATALDTASATAINIAVTALKIPAGLLKTAVPAIGPAVDTLIGGLEMVATCLTTGGPTIAAISNVTTVL